MNQIMAVNRTLVLVAFVLLSGCKRNSEPSKGVATGDQHAPRATSRGIAELLGAVPGTAAALVFVDLAQPPWALLTNETLLDEPARKSLDKEMREYLDRYLGLDLSKLQYAVGFVAGPPGRGAVLLKAVGGQLKMPGASEYEGAKLWIVDADKHVSLAIKGDVVVFGKDDAVREALDTLAGKRKPVTTENKPLVEWLRKESAGAVLAFAAIAPKDLPLPPPIAGLERVAIRIGPNGIAAVVEGSAATIDGLQAMSDQAFATVLSKVELARQAALAGTIPPPEGAGAIIGAAYAKAIAAKLKPQRKGNQLSVSLDLGSTNTDPVMVVAVIGVLAAVAIPAFMEYMRKSDAPSVGDKPTQPAP